MVLRLRIPTRRLGSGAEIGKRDGKTGGGTRGEDVWFWVWVGVRFQGLVGGDLGVVSACVVNGPEVMLVI